jgi:hypothetical protein
MNHPNREEWMGFLYEEVDSAEKTRLTAHLRECAPCQQQLARWRETMGVLDRWNLRAPARIPLGQQWLRWAAAAAVLLAAGVTIGSAVAKSDTASLRKDLQSQRVLIDQLSRTIAENRTRDQQAFVATLRELEIRRTAELATLRGDLETVAALTQDSLDRAQNQLVRLASYTGAGAR